jgi:translation initiation factor IF-2
MSNKTVRQLAEVVKIPLERLLEQLKEAGLSASAPDDVINEDEKMQLLAHLRKRHGKDEGAAEGSLKRVTLKRRTVSELKQASVPGTTTKTISVEVRKQRTYVKRSEVPDSEEQKKLELAAHVLKESMEQPAENLPSVETPVKVPEVVLEQKEEEIIVEPTVVKSVEAVEVVAAPESQEKIEVLPVEEEPETEQENLAQVRESTEARKKQSEKDIRLEDSIKRNADKVRQQATAKQEILQRRQKRQEKRQEN